MSACDVLATIALWGWGGGRLKPLGARSSGVEKGAKNEQNRQKPAGGACRKPSSGTACYDQTFLRIGDRSPMAAVASALDVYYVEPSAMWSPNTCTIRVLYIYANMQNNNNNTA